ncbi:hypothetical protein [Ammoniphilus sp. 3BR4]|uniref:hypothetical protein n=1 Tax=Ammoniphilus sp. 3BR4 TaxID=3158265 RepID=UPI003465C88D
MDERINLPGEYTPAVLTMDQLEQIKRMEKELGVILIAYERDITEASMYQS